MDINKPLIPADKSKFWATVLEPIIFWMLEKNFFTIRIKDKDNFCLRNKNYGTLLYGFHSCFWDGITVYYVAKKVFCTNLYMMVKDLYKLPLLAKLGAFSVEKNCFGEALKSLNYTANLLKDRKNTVWVFPQGTVVPPHYRPVKFKSGMSFISNKLQGVNLLPMSVKYTFLNQDKPEIFIHVGTPIISESFIKNKKEYTRMLEKNFTELQNIQAEEISSGNLEDYEILYQGKLPLIRRVEPFTTKYIFANKLFKFLNLRSFL